MAGLMSLVNHLLIASPSFNDPLFSHTLIYVCEHHPEGTVGLIINRPTPFSMSLVFDQLHIKGVSPETQQLPLLFGGPIQPERGFVVHRPQGRWTSSLKLLPHEVTITTSNDIIRAIAEDKGPQDALVVLGYVEWRAQALEEAILSDNWVVCPFKPELLYEVPFDARWEAAGLTMGIHMKQLLGAGHA